MFRSADSSVQIGLSLLYRNAKFATVIFTSDTVIAAQVYHHGVWTTIEVDSVVARNPRCNVQRITYFSSRQLGEIIQSDMAVVNGERVQ